MSPATAATARRSTTGATARRMSVPASRKKAVPRRPPLRVVAPPIRDRRRSASLLSIVLIVTSLLSVVVGHSILDQNQVRLTGLTTSLGTATISQQKDLLSVATLENPERIVGEAENHGQVTSVPSQVPFVPLNVVLPAPKLASATTSPPVK